MARRRLEDERFASFAEASIVFLDLPDAVFRGYEGDDGAAERAARRRPRARSRSSAARSPGSSRRRSTCRSGSATTSTTSSAATSASALLAEGRRWVMPGPGLRRDRHVLRGLPVRLVERLQPARGPAAGARSPDLPPDVGLVPDVRRHRRPARAEDHRHQRSTRARSSGSSPSPKEMARQVRAHARKTALLGGWGGSAERYWSTGPA